MLIYYIFVNNKSLLTGNRNNIEIFLYSWRALYRLCAEVTNCMRTCVHSMTYVMSSCIRRRLTTDTCWETCEVFKLESILLVLCTCEVANFSCKADDIVDDLVAVLQAMIVLGSWSASDLTGAATVLLRPIYLWQARLHESNTPVAIYKVFSRICKSQRETHMRSADVKRKSQATSWSDTGREVSNLPSTQVLLWWRSHKVI